MSSNTRSPLAAYVVPFALFLGGLALVSAVEALGGKSDLLWLQKPAYWVYPLQTLVCAGALIFYWRQYDFGARGGWWLALAGGVLVLAIWLAPQELLRMAPRIEGFDPTVFEEDPVLYWLTVVARFARLVVVVPLIEEIFWRGFLMRYLIKEDFKSVAFGAYTPLSFFGVAGLFMLVHGTADWPAAFLAGLIYNFIAIRTKSLGACVAAHAITNLGLGFYIMVTRQWGFW